MYISVSNPKNTKAQYSTILFFIQISDHLGYVYYPKYELYESHFQLLNKIFDKHL